MPRSLLSIVVFALAAVVLTAALVVPTGAVTVDEPSEGVALQTHDGLNGQYVSHSGEDELELHFDRLNDRAESEFDEAFTITAAEAGAVWIDESIEGVTFYVDDPENELDESERITLEANESVTVGVAVDTDVAESGTETFTVGAERHDTKDRELPPRTTAALGGPLALCLLFLFTAANSRRKL